MPSGMAPTLWWWSLPRNNNGWVRHLPMQQMQSVAETKFWHWTPSPRLIVTPAIPPALRIKTVQTLPSNAGYMICEKHNCSAHLAKWQCECRSRFHQVHGHGSLKLLAGSLWLAVSNKFVIGTIHSDYTERCSSRLLWKMFKDKIRYESLEVRHFPNLNDKQEIPAQIRWHTWSILWYSVHNRRVLRKVDLTQVKP